jgi:hypothetical protein
MIVINQRNIGKHFRYVEPGSENIGIFFQYLNTQTGRWTPSTYTKKEGYKNDQNSQNYRKPYGLIGYIIVIFGIIGRYWNKLKNINIK